MTALPSTAAPATADPRHQPEAEREANRAQPAGDSGNRLKPKLVLMGADTAAVALAMLATYLLQDALIDAGVGGAAEQQLVISLATLPGWLVIFTHQHLYNTRFIARRIDEFRRVVNAALLGSLLGLVIGNAFGYLAPRSGVVLTFVLSVSLVMVEREVARRIFASLRGAGRLLRHVVIAGTNPEARELAAMLQSDPWLGYRVLGFVGDDPRQVEPVPGIARLGGFDDAADIVRRHRGASVIVAASAVESDITNRLARDLLDEGIHVELSSTLRDIASHRLTVRPLGRFPVVYVEPVLRSGWRASFKRSFDILGAAAALALTAPFVLVAAIAIKLNSRGPVVFHQTRVGRNGKPFQVLKLRSMVVDAEDQMVDLLAQNEADGPLFKMKRDPRVTRVGGLLRTTSIDEIPQLVNVLKGEMSLVGPRPALPHETEAWDPLLSQRLRVKPGITGMWQVNGRSESSFEDYTRLDLYYVDNWSLTTDLAILAKTVPVVLARRGAA